MELIHGSLLLKKQDKAYIGFIFMIVLSVLMCLAELVVGHLAHSIALVADSFHMFFDILSLTIGLFSHQLSKCKTKTPRYPYGFSRASTLGGFINSAFMLSLCLILYRESTERIIHMKEVENIKVVLVTAIFGLVVNIIGFFVFHSAKHNNPFKSVTENTFNDPISALKSLDNSKIELLPDRYVSCYEHSTIDDHSHDHNLSGVLLHIIGDALGSVFVIISTVVIMVSENPMANVLDPITSFILASVMTCSTVPLLFNTSKILLHLPPKRIDKYLFENMLKNCADKHNVTFIGYNIYQTTENYLICNIVYISQENNPMNYIDNVKRVADQFGIKELNVLNQNVPKDQLCWPLSTP